jgi:hypothetical protein
MLVAIGVTGLVDGRRVAVGNTALLASLGIGILAGDEGWGPIHAFHWWGKPDAGYYCLAEKMTFFAITP